jgi:hypothetical protein
LNRGINRDGSQTLKEEVKEAAILYRRIIALRDAETDNIGRAQLDLIARRLRASWIAWHGEGVKAESRQCVDRSPLSAACAQWPS